MSKKNKKFRNEENEIIVESIEESMNEENQNTEIIVESSEVIEKTDVIVSLEKKLEAIKEPNKIVEIPKQKISSRRRIIY